MEYHKMDKYYCNNCGNRIGALYKQYSATVLKLTDCKVCHETADKYVEFDIVIIIIDLILLNPKAYRHVLLNTPFKNFWKLAIILVLLEAYCKFSLTNKSLDTCCDKVNKTEPSLQEFDMNLEDLRFYAVVLNIALSTYLTIDIIPVVFVGYLSFVVAIYGFTELYQKFHKTRQKVSFQLVAKIATLASAGVFLQLPSIIWDISQYNFHLNFICSYIFLSQLLAYQVIAGTSKIWCLLAIFSSHIIKAFISYYLDFITKSVFV